MDSKQLTNINVESHDLLPTPEDIHSQLPLSESAAGAVLRGREAIQNILDEKDRRIFVVVGPCSIHDTQAALEYAERLEQLADRVQEQMVLVMRVYFEKPRTTVGWKGLVNDPYMDDSFNIKEGLKIGRKLLLQLAESGLPTASEALDPVVPQYLSDLISWTAIGARTTESQTHRELASGLSMPVGFKNGTDGNIQVAINAMKSSLSPHGFLGVDSNGRISIYKTRGNRYSHVVLRGGTQPNYDAESVAACAAALEKAGLRKKIMIDCSHGNSSKDHNKQPAVFRDVIGQITAGNQDIVGLMVESNLFEGNQEIPGDLSRLKYGVSVTDKCIDWPTTETVILEACHQLATRR
jgi:3-deoxy-7-phosphoheptulonate synthase